MNVLKCFLIGALCGVPLQAESRWIQLQSGDFKIYSAASERETREILTRFERLRSFFIEMSGYIPAPTQPVTIVVFDSTKDYEPYRPNEFIFGHAAGGSDQDRIVLSKILPGKTADAIIRDVNHAYLHVAARDAGLDLPLWLSEGLAELSRSLNLLPGDAFEFGAPIVERVRDLRQEQWVPLATLFQVTEDSSLYHEAEKDRPLYNQGWLLVQFLTTSEVYAPRFGRLFQAIAEGTPSADAFEKIYERPLAAVEDDLKRYINRGIFRKSPTRMKLDRSGEKLPVEPANMFEVRLAVAHISPKKEDARTRFEELAREEPKRSEPWTGLGYLAWRNRDSKAAVDSFSKAYDLGDRSPKMLWDYGRLAATLQPQDSMRALNELLKLQPENLDARIELASVQMNTHQAEEALTTAASAIRVTPQQGERLYYVMASAQLQLGDRTSARSSALRLESKASTRQYKDYAAQILRYLDRADQQAQSGEPVTAAPLLADPGGLPVGGAPGRVALIRRPEIETEVEVEFRGPALPKYAIQGRIVAMECSEAPTLTVETDQGSKTFVILEPNRIVTSGEQPTAEGIPCGAQPKPVLVRIHYDSSPVGVTADGVVREIHFQ